MRILAAIIVSSLASCGTSELERDNKQLKQENQTVKQQNAQQEENKVKSEAATKEAENRAKQAKDAELAAKLEAEEAKKQAEAATAKANELAATSAAVSSELAVAHSPLKPFNGIWVTERANSALPSDCETLILVKGNILTEGVVCANGQNQTTRYKVSGYKVRGDIFPGSLGLSSSLSKIDSTCSQNQTSIVRNSSELVFDYSTSAGATPATKMFSLDKTNQRKIFQTTSQRRDFGNVATCEAVEQLVEVNPGIAKLQLALNICKKTFAVEGCFTASGFVEKQ